MNGSTRLTGSRAPFTCSPAAIVAGARVKKLETKRETAVILLNII
jgi:hypothetical protein